MTISGKKAIIHRSNVYNKTRTNKDSVNYKQQKNFHTYLHCNPRKHQFQKPNKLNRKTWQRVKNSKK